MASRTTPLAQFSQILRSRVSAAQKATTIVELAPRLPEEALPVMDDFLDAAEPLVQVAIMDAYFELTGDAYHEEDLIALMDRAAGMGDQGEELYFAARIALGRVQGDPHEAWQAPSLTISGVRRPRRRPGIRRQRHAARDSVTIMIHGTWAADGQWWKPRGDFFEYVKTELDRSDLYSSSDRFSWSGKNSHRERSLAGTSLSTWLRGHPSAEVNVFAHSHGANVAMLSTWSNATIDRLVMLSPPVRRDYFADWGRVKQAFNIQSSWDPVVAIAKGGKWFADCGVHHVSEIELEANGHSASHDPSVWREEGVASLIGAPW